MRPSIPPTILGTIIHPTTYRDATALILGWAVRAESRSVCLANVHMVMEAYDDPAYEAEVNGADLAAPDGMPIVWILKLLGHDVKDRVYGPTLTLRVLEAAAMQEVPVGFYGASSDVLAALIVNVRQKFPGLCVTYSCSPPFREPTSDEDEATVRDINASGARILFVGLGCPKQERWMHQHKGRVQAVMLGVGAAFDFHAGAIPQAPSWMRDRGLEWLFRLCVEPRRLWKRHLLHNPRFVILSILELLGLGKQDRA
ncbi:WecB/TagA/CpsF family glycosyltransferase [Desulfomicrobium baculatum]|uniref:Glycosyl transferase, WecB/TagA/CpsF family n=1 Tax=Desulfomicrobium baculatum (strain DSM 4028 / VKM B-1378 / X) TaxID=525897 RepID=C7LQ91_DESBD|nr:WecB/TagA/CpsF family glycosyltransferase [Desulfomicrobium baculatum]ACU89117.1 glycosyl transferase, WecB/TagA/CpsF family [Desulfomicrobium baculatum DSM 4028]